jgi:hypothetical protein
MHSYGYSRKYQDVWKTLIDQHLAAGHIQVSNASMASLAFCQDSECGRGHGFGT